MIVDIHITEKSFGPKILMSDVRFSVDDGEKVGIVGRNGVGKSTLFGILAGTDRDYGGDVTYRRGITLVTTAQEHHGVLDQTVLQYILSGLPEYAQLSHIVEAYPDTMGDDMTKITEYTEALERFEQKGFYQIEEVVTRELEQFQLSGVAHRPIASLSGGQKRLIEIVKVMHADAHLALIDEPTNHMDYVAKQQFVDWMVSERAAGIAMLVITHDRDVLAEVDRIVELRDGGAVSYRGNYDAYLKQNAERTSTGMNEHEMVEKRMTNLRAKIIDYQRLKEKSRNPSTIQKFKRLENQSRAELAELEKVEKPNFWIDKSSVEQLDYKSAGRYDKFKARNIRMNIRGDESRSKHVLVSVKDLSLGYTTPLFAGVNIDLREGEAVELRGRNGAGKSTLIRALLAVDKKMNDEWRMTNDAVTSQHVVPHPARDEGSSSRDVLDAGSESGMTQQAATASTPAAQLTTRPEKGFQRSATPIDTERSAASDGRETHLSRDERGDERASLATTSSPPPQPSSLEGSALPAEPTQDKANSEVGVPERDDGRGLGASQVPTLFNGTLNLDPHIRIGVYEQEISPRYFDLTLHDAIERVYLDRQLSISETKIRQLMSDYLFTESDGAIPVSSLSGGQKARLQIISMLANDPQLLILDEPTNHLDLPSIEELESALQKYAGAILYVSHDGYFRDAIGGEVVKVGA